MGKNMVASSIQSSGDSFCSFGRAAIGRLRAEASRVADYRMAGSLRHLIGQRLPGCRRVLGEGSASLDCTNEIVR